MIRNKKAICLKPEAPADMPTARVVFPRGLAVLRFLDGFLDELGLFRGRPVVFLPVAFERVRAAATCPSVSRMVFRVAP